MRNGDASRGFSRRGVLRGLGLGTLGLAGSALLPAAAGAALPDYVSGSVIQSLLNDARDGIGSVDSAGRRIVRPPVATYLLTQPLIVYANTFLDVTGIRIVSRFPASGVKHTMVLNSVGSSVGGYSGAGNIVISGGSWDPVWDFVQRGVLSSAPAMNVITMIHARDVTIQGATIWNVKHYHAIELNAVDTALVTGCTLRGWIADPDNGLWHGEAVQLDIPNGTTTWAGLTDLTPCRNITITGTVCDTSGSQPGWGQLTGSHTVDAAHPHDIVTIIGNEVRNARWDGIATVNASNVCIANNTVQGCEGGIYVKSVAGGPLHDVEIFANTITGIGDRPALAVRADASNGTISEVYVGNNTVNCAQTFYYGDVRFESGTTGQCG